jgi:co-chaperonin GroES (HSP10)
VKPDAVEEMTPGGIAIPKSITDKHKFLTTDGVVVAIGPDAWKAFRQVDDTGKLVNGQPWAKIGDRVTYSKNAGKFVKNTETGEEFVVMNDEDIVLVHGEEEISE